MSDELPTILVVDDHDDPDPYILTGMGHYAVQHAYRDELTGALVIVLDYHGMFVTIRDHITNPPDPGPPPTATEPGSP